MKLRSILAALAMTVAAVSQAAEARIATYGENRPKERPVTPVSLNLVTPIGLPWGDYWDVSGFQVGVYNRVEDFTGCQLGVFNVTDTFCGLQFGVINYTRRMYGVQIGVFNIITDSDLAFFPIVNWYF